MKFLKLDKKKGSGGPSIKSRYAYLILIDDLDYFPSTDAKGVRLEGDILLKEDCKMMPLYLTNSSQEFSYDIVGNDDEKSYKVKFSGTHPGTELEALEFAKNQIEQPYLVLIPGCNSSDPWKLLGEITNPLIFTSTHKSGRDGSKFTFNFEQRIESEFIYFSYGGVEVPSSAEGENPPGGGFDPSKWSRIDASNIDPFIQQWREKLGVSIADDKTFTLGAVTATTSSIHLALHSSGVNSVRIAGQILSKSTRNDWNFPEVTLEKVFTGYAINDPDVFHLALDGEEIPAGALKIFQVIISEYGINIDEFAYGSKMKSDDQWRNAYLSIDEGDYLPLDDERSSINLIIDDAVVTPVLYGVMTVRVGTADKNFAWNGKEFTFYTERDVLLSSQESNPVAALPFIDGTNYVAKAGTFTRLKLWDNKVCIISSYVDLTPYALNADLILEKNARIAADDAEIVNRAAADNNLQSQLNAANLLIADLRAPQITIITTSSITTDTLSVSSRAQNGKNVIIDNGVNAINLQCVGTSPANFVASYSRLGSGVVTITAGIGVTVEEVYSGSGKVCNGAIMSSFTLERVGTKFYLKLNNA